MNLARKLSDVARRYGDKPAIVFEDSVFTFNDLEKQVEHYQAIEKTTLAGNIALSRGRSDPRVRSGRGGVGPRLLPRHDREGRFRDRGHRRRAGGAGRRVRPWLAGSGARAIPKPRAACLRVSAAAFLAW